MTSPLRALEKYFEPVVIVFALAAIVVLVFADVVARFALSTSIAPANEAARLALVYLIYFGVSYAITSQLGIDPVHFGIVMIVALAIGFVTPPLGANLFMAAQVGRISFDAVVRRILPWVLTMIAALLLIAAWPGLSLALPRSLLDYGG